MRFYVERLPRVAFKSIGVAGDYYAIESILDFLNLENAVADAGNAADEKAADGSDRSWQAADVGIFGFRSIEIRISVIPQLLHHRVAAVDAALLLRFEKNNGPVSSERLLQPANDPRLMPFDVNFDQRDWETRFLLLQYVVASLQRDLECERG